VLSSLVWRFSYDTSLILSRTNDVFQMIRVPKGVLLVTIAATSFTILSVYWEWTTVKFIVIVRSKMLTACCSSLSNPQYSSFWKPTWRTLKTWQPWSSVQKPSATAYSISESRHEHFPFPSLDLSCCCYSLSCGWAKPEPGWASEPRRWAHGGQGRPVWAPRLRLPLAKIGRSKAGVLSGPILDPCSQRAAPNDLPNLAKFNFNVCKHIPIC